MTDTARVLLWGSDIGAVTWVEDRDLAVFQYTPEFAQSGIEVAPLTMPLSAAPYEFPSLARKTFHGLPGLLADSLPDRFGNALIDAWLASQGRRPESFTPVERLCYTGARGVGALEFKPAIEPPDSPPRRVEIDALVALANRALDERVALEGRLDGADDRRAIEDILRVGTSAGGARAKAVLAWNPQTGEFRSGQVEAGDGFEHWLIKFDGVHGNRDRELDDPQGFGRIEYAYHLMARAAAVDMAECRLHEEGGRAHFMTKRFDRSAAGDKLHMQSLGAIRHFDFNRAGEHAYEQAVQTIRALRLPVEDVEQQVRRALFNVITRNQDDHVKNIAFLMNRRGTWRLSPAFDVAYAHNPSGDWTHRHQMRMNGKQNGFERDDLWAFARSSGLKRTRTRGIVEAIAAAVQRWPLFAETAGVPDHDARRIEQTFRTRLLAGA